MSAIDSLSFHAGGNSIRARFVTPGLFSTRRLLKLHSFSQGCSGLRPHSGGKLIDKRALFPLPPNDSIVRRFDTRGKTRAGFRGRKLATRTGISHLTPADVLSDSRQPKAQSLAKLRSFLDAEAKRPPQG